MTLDLIKLPSYDIFSHFVNQRDGKAKQVVTQEETNNVQTKQEHQQSIVHLFLFSFLWFFPPPQ